MASTSGNELTIKKKYLSPIRKVVSRLPYVHNVLGISTSR